MSDEKRQYQMRKRADLEAQTRLRITESAMELHGSVGPSRTTISAVAERAGVQRSTVYRHFPDEAALFAACSGHWMQLNPVPDPGAWAAIADPDERLKAALGELYPYYAANEEMLGNLSRDEETVEIVRTLFAGYHGYVEAVADLLMDGRRGGAAAKRRVRAAIGHALEFRTWQSLVRGRGLGDAQAADLMGRLVASAAT